MLLLHDWRRETAPVYSVFLITRSRFSFQFNESQIVSKSLDPSLDPGGEFIQSVWLDFLRPERWTCGLMWTRSDEMASHWQQVNSPAEFKSYRASLCFEEVCTAWFALAESSKKKKGKKERMQIEMDVEKFSFHVNLQADVVFFAKSVIFESCFFSPRSQNKV